jgi:hypothetical protein
MEIPNIQPEPAKANYKSLRAWNWSMSLLHLIQGVVMVIISNASSLPVTTAYLKIDPSNPVFGVAPTPEIWFNLRLGPTVAAFLFLSAIAHFLLAGPLRGWYEKNLALGMNKLRWFEYMFSSSIMIVVISMLCGIYDFWLLVSLFALNAIMNLMGLVMEVHNQTTTKTNWLSYNIGVLAGAVPWVVILASFFAAINSTGVKLPNFVYAIVFTIFATFSIFAVNMILQYKKVGPWKNYLYGERAYMILSLVAKSLLAWQMFSGTLRP